MKTTLLLVMILFASSVKGQTNYYVGAAGVDTPTNGTLASPWRSIQYGLNRLSTGDTLNVMSGTFTEKLTIPISGITLRKHPNAGLSLQGTGLTSQTAMIKISNKSNIVIDGLEIRYNIMPDAQGILVEGSCQNITISNCAIHNIHFSSNPNDAVNANTNAQGIIVYGSNATTPISNLKILNNTLYDCRLGYSEGIAVNGNVDGFEVSGNSVYQLTNIGIVAIGHEGVCSNPANDQARNGVLKNNEVYQCLSPYATSAGLYVDGAKNIVIENNSSRSNGYGIEVGCENIGKAADNITVRNNIIYNNQVCAIALGGYAYPSGSGKVTNAVIRNNSCYTNDYSHSGNGELYLSYSEGSKIENNIFYTSSDNILAAAENAQPSLQFNYNIIYCEAGALALSAQWNTSSYASYSTFVTGTGTNINSLFADPLWPSPGSYNFHLKALSPAINKGNPASVAASGEKDLDGQPRANGILDCGADEYYAVTAIDQASIKASKIIVYPNPTNGIVKIVSNDISWKYIMLYDAAGQVMETWSGEQSSDLIWNVSAYAKGLYYIIATDDKGIPSTQKLVVQ
jgi:Right handed beta helix region/Secretion system C-terminal sorting domain